MLNLLSCVQNWFSQTRNTLTSITLIKLNKVSLSMLSLPMFFPFILFMLLLLNAMCIWLTEKVNGKMPAKCGCHAAATRRRTGRCRQTDNSISTQQGNKSACSTLLYTADWGGRWEQCIVSCSVGCSGAAKRVGGCCV